jgi:hypothetical protein
MTTSGVVRAGFLARCVIAVRDEARASGVPRGRSATKPLRFATSTPEPRRAASKDEWSTGYPIRRPTALCVNARKRPEIQRASVIDQQLDSARAPMPHACSTVPREAVRAFLARP